ncbi:MAG: LysE family transporter [Clostridiales bacterium]|nr:LysE family transporter [Clostridiales bacterium]
MVIKGLRFGMLLQIAIGPMCLFVFNTAASRGLGMGLLLVCAIALTDALYISLSGLGISAVLNRPKIRKAVQVCGAAILVLFGTNTILNVFGVSILPSIRLFSDVTGKTIFVQGLLLTASNPLTIVFWSGVFSTQIIEHDYNKRQLAAFGIGCVLATLLFLSLVACLGTVVKSFISAGILAVLNIGVGAVIIFFGIRLLVSPQKNQESA